jgi:putative transposase
MVSTSALRAISYIAKRVDGMLIPIEKSTRRNRYFHQKRASCQVDGISYVTWPGFFVPAVVRQNSLWREAGMPMRKYKPEQIAILLRQVEVELANGKTTPQACKEAEITAQTYYRSPKESGGLKLDQTKRLKERENAKL